METKKRALGVGLEQLFNNENLDLQSFEKHVYETTKKEEIIEVNLNELRPNPYQPRKVFDTSALEEDYGFKPTTALRDGLRKFAKWYKDYYSK